MTARLSRFLIQPASPPWRSRQAAYPQTSAYDRSGVLGGGQLGCNWQVTNWVVAIETDFDGTGSPRRTDHQQRPAARLLSAHVDVTQKMDWIGTTRGRLGVVAGNNILLYGTAGVAYAGVHDSYFQSDAAAGGPVNIFASDSNDACLAGRPAAGPRWDLPMVG